MNLLPSNWIINTAIWAVIAGAIILWQVATARSRNLPSFGDLIRTARRYWILRWGLLVIWMWVGWHLFVRTTLGE